MPTFKIGKIWYENDFKLFCILQSITLRGGKLEFKHKPVMLKECIEGLNIKQDGIYVDGTLGGAGHSKEILKRLSKNGLLIGIDRDEDALKATKENLKEFSNVKFVKGNHDDIKQILSDLQIEKVDGILLDLGVSSYQLDERNRGFSYLGENELDMRMDKSQQLTAKEVVNTYAEEELANIIYEYGEERFSRQIARNICEYRKNQEIQTTKQLVEIIEKSIPKSKQNDGHPAKRTFQAIRIEVNNEIKPLYNTIKDSIECLKPQGRLCVITFHSLEDRAVKNAMKDAMRKMHLSTRFTLLCMWRKVIRKANYKKTNCSNRGRTRGKFKKQKCKT